MKEAFDLLKAAFETGQVTVFALAALAVAPFLYKVMKEGTALVHSVREKKLAALLSCVDQGIENRHPFSVEQCFASNYGSSRPYSYDEIAFLLDRASPTRAFRDYAWGQRLLSFSRKSGAQLRKPINYRAREVGWTALFTLSFIVALCAAIVTYAASVSEHAGKLLALESATVLLMSASLGFLSLWEIRALFAAKRLLEQGSHTFSARAVPMTHLPPSSSTLEENRPLDGAPILDALNRRTQTAANDPVQVRAREQFACEDPPSHVAHPRGRGNADPGPEIRDRLAVGAPAPSHDDANDVRCTLKGCQ
jgi:hypothetical protein